LSDSDAEAPDGVVFGDIADDDEADLAASADSNDDEDEASAEEDNNAAVAADAEDDNAVFSDFASDSALGARISACCLSARSASSTDERQHQERTEYNTRAKPIKSA
jgi:hypothetical protein